MKRNLYAQLIFITFLFASCSGGSGGSSSNDQQDPSDNENTETNSEKVVCLQQNLKNLPDDYKKVIELSAAAVIKCKANRADVDEFIKKRKD